MNNKKNPIGENYLYKMTRIATQYRKLFYIFSGPFLIILLGAYFYLMGGKYLSTDNAYLKAEKISIATEISGRVERIHVKDNTFVQPGQILFTVEKEPFILAVHQAEAALLTIENELTSSKASYHQKIAALEASAANLEFLKAEFIRSQQLAHRDFIAQAKFDEARFKKEAGEKNYEALRFDAEAEKAKLNNNPTLPIQEYSAYKKGLAQLEKAKLDLTHTEIVSPFAGTVAQVTSITPGTYVTVGMPLFNIVQNQKMWIEANFKETDLTFVKPGQEAVLEVDTYPDKKWKAKVVSISPATGSEFSILPAQNSSGNWVKVVQRIMVRLEIDHLDDAIPLSAGMSSNVTINTGQNKLMRLFNSGQK